MNMKNMPWLDGAFAFGATVSPKASASVSKHCAPVQTVCRSSESRTSSMPGRCAAFWQTQFIRSSHTVIALQPCDQETPRVLLAWGEGCARARARVCVWGGGTRGASSCCCMHSEEWQGIPGFYSCCSMCAPRASAVCGVRLRCCQCATQRTQNGAHWQCTTATTACKLHTISGSLAWNWIRGRGDSS